MKTRKRETKKRDKELLKIWQLLKEILKMLKGG